MAEVRDLMERCDVLTDENAALKYRMARLESALSLIGRTGCESFTSGHCETAGRIRGARYAAFAWCDSCIANEALGRSRERVAD